jgi:hypothetical protein
MDLTGKFSLKKIEGIFNAPLKDVNNTTLLEESLEKDVNHQSGAFAFSAGGGIGIKIQLFNDPDDDNDHELAKVLRIEDDIKKGFVFLGYEVNGKLKGTLKANLDPVALGLSATGEVTHQSFLKHPNTTKLIDGVTKDIKNFKLAFDSGSLKELENYEAVILHSKGALDFDARVSVSDTFTPLLSRISKLIDTAEPVSMKIDLSASVTVTLGISDTFQTVIQRRDVGEQKSYTVSINKEFKSKRHMSGSIGFSAAISNPEVINNTIDSILEKGVEGLTKELDTLKDKALAQLSAKELELLKKGAKLIGVDPEKSSGDLLKAYFDKKDTVVKKIKELVASELKLSLSYTYEKTKETKAVWKGSFTDAAFQKHHEKIVKLQVKELYAEAKTAFSGITLTEYLDLSKINIVRSAKIGFSISAFELSQLVRKEVEFEDEVIADYEGEVQHVSFSSSKFTSEKLGVFKERENSMILAGSHSTAEKPEIFMTNLDYEFSLHWSENYKKLDHAKLKKALDFAVTWGIVDEAKFGEQEVALTNMLRDKEKVKFSAFIKMKKGLFDAIIDDILTISDHQRYNTLAASVPYANYPGRQTPSQRKASYYSLFHEYFKQNPATIDYNKLKEVIGKHLRTIGETALADFEEGIASDFDYEPINKVLQFNFVGVQFKNFQNAMEELNNGTKPFQSIIKSPKFLRNLNGMRLQPEFNMRFMGRLILDLSQADGIADAVERTMTIEYKDDKDKDQKFVLAR